MKKYFQEPELEVEKIEVEDVITTSCDGYTPCSNELPGM